VLVVAAALAAGLIAASQIGAGEAGPPAAVPFVHVGLEGVAQRGAALGRADAPVTLVEYADLQCPYCGEWARRSLPVIVDEYVRTGRVRIVFRGLAFLGPDSALALRAVMAAGDQNKLWSLVEDMYRRQRLETAAGCAPRWAPWRPSPDSIGRGSSETPALALPRARSCGTPGSPGPPASAARRRSRSAAPGVGCTS
jgi:hypothetical protein